MSQQERVDGLNRLLRIECRSYVHYLRDAEFLAHWDNLGFEAVDPQLASTLERVVEAEAGHVDRILDCLAVAGGTPDFASSYALEEGVYNYLRADYFLSILIQRLRENEGQFAAALQALEGIEPDCSQMTSILEGKRSHIGELEALASQEASSTEPEEAAAE